jgi:uncharacterized protein YegP (UPF0339 family)
MTKKIPKVHIYPAADGFRWRLRARNGRVIAESGEAYTNRSKCRDGWLRVGRTIRTVVEVVYDEPRAFDL